MVNVIGLQDMDPASSEPAVYAAPGADALPQRSGEAGQ